jgi:succinate dehydrogenase/fumarate reductase-like Fe-S protein
MASSVAPAVCLKANATDVRLTNAGQQLNALDNLSKDHVLACARFVACQQTCNHHIVLEEMSFIVKVVHDDRKPETHYKRTVALRGSR